MTTVANKNAFERQKDIFGEFIENARDVLSLKLKDDIKISFTEKSISFDDLAEIIITPHRLIPVIRFKKDIENKGEIILCKNILNNTSEITQIFKEYLLLYSHLDNFTNLASSNDLVYQKLVDEIEFLSTLEVGYFDGDTWFISQDNDHQYFLKCIKYGNAKKQEVDMCYMVKSRATGTIQDLFKYQISKDEFAGDVAYQLSSQTLTHVK